MKRDSWFGDLVLVVLGAVAGPSVGRAAAAAVELGVRAWRRVVRSREVSAPVPVSAAYVVASQLLTVWFSRPIASVDVALGRLHVENSPTGFRETSLLIPSINGTVVVWAMDTSVTATVPPSRLDFVAGAGNITSTEGRVVLPFSNFPCTIT